MTLLDVRRCVPEVPVHTDLCIAGAGAAGIALAREFLGARCRVTLLESGGLRYSSRVQQLYAGEQVGQPSYALAYSRIRVFGGSTTRWAAQCRPLDAIDFQVRPGFDRSGWPFDRRHIQMWEPRAIAVCGLGSDEARRSWMADGESLPIADDQLDAILFRFGYPRDFGQAYRLEFERASNVDVLLGANVVAIDPAPDLGSIQAMPAASGSAAASSACRRSARSVAASASASRPRRHGIELDRSPDGRSLRTFFPRFLGQA